VAVGRVSDNRPHDLKDVVKGFMEVDGVGGGVLMIKRDTITRMLKALPEISDPDIGGHPGITSIKSYGGNRLIRAFDKTRLEDGKRLSEDLAFCDRVKKSGGSVWANVDHFIGHIGPYNYGIRYQDFLENKAAEAKSEAA
jgi:hypothetical protein